MKNFTLSFVLLGAFLGTSGVDAQITGEDCNNPIAVSSLPYNDSGDTADYGSNYFGSPGSDCASTSGYLNGDDVVYHYASGSNTAIDIVLSDLSDVYAGIFIYEDCADIGSQCVAGAVNAFSSDDIEIKGLLVTSGQDYYIVISTWAFPQSVEYTLDIDEIDCNDYSDPPSGNASQNFPAGQGWTLADLSVSGTDLTWYDDPAGTAADEIPDTTVLVDGETYYVSQTYGSCESSLLAVTVVEINCNNFTLEITDTTDGTIVCKGMAALEAEAAGGDGDDIFWYDAATGGDLVGVGPTFTTPELTTTTSYWAVEVLLSGSGATVGQGMQTWNDGFGWWLYADTGLRFTATDSFVILDVEVFSTGTVGQQVIALQDNSGNDLQTTTVTLPTGTSGSPAAGVTVPLNFAIPGPGQYRLAAKYSGPPASALMTYEYFWPDLGYPFPLGSVGEIIGSFEGTWNMGPEYYHYFYNWTIMEGDVLCESDPEEVIATVTTDGDEEVITPLPYTHSENTATYGNTFTGTPGSDCGDSENYLNGADVVYYFEADQDDILTITLSDLSDFYAGIFLYEVCADIGDTCLDGGVNEASDDDIILDEIYVEQGDVFYIVVSSWLSTDTDYTLTVEGFDCASFEAPDGDSQQNFVIGDTLADLDVEGTMQGVDFTWYEDDNGSPGNTLPDTSPLTDGDTYWVTQTLTAVNCEGQALAITVTEIDCTILDISGTTGDAVSCKGSMTLTAQTAGTGTGEIYWYDTPTGGSPIGIGPSFETPVLTQTTSYWASEVYTEGAAVPGQGMQTWNDGFGWWLYNDTGLRFNATDSFVILDVEVFSTGTVGQQVIALQDSSGNDLQTTTVTLPTGTSGSPAAGVTVPLSFTVPGPGQYRLAAKYSGTSPASALMTYEYLYPDVGYPFPLGNVGEIVGSFEGTYNFGPEYYHYFYNWTIQEGEALCESPREEAVATVNQTGDIQVTPLPYTHSSNTAGYGNNFSGGPGSGCSGSDYLDGADVVYQYSPANDDIISIELVNPNANAGVFVYESCGEVGDDCVVGATDDDGFLIEDFYVTGGQDYFIVVSSQSGNTSYTLQINGFECSTLEPPDGEEDQYFITGYTIDDLIVTEYMHSSGLSWYEDAGLTIPIANPSAEVLMDGETYYVTQMVLGCEGSALEITVHEFECTDLDILSTDGGYICEEGTVVLTAQSTGIGSEIYWYQTETGDDQVGQGTEFETPHLTQTTSFWAGEVFTHGETAMGGQGMQTWNDGFGWWLYASTGLKFTATGSFTIVDVEVFSTGTVGQQEIALQDSSGDDLQTTTVTLPTGSSGSPAAGVVVPLNFTVPEPGEYRLVAKYSGPPNSALMSYEYYFPNIGYPFPLGNVGEITGSIEGSFESESYYYYFYNWTITVPQVVCASDRVETVAEINDVFPPEPAGNGVQEFCEKDIMGNSVTLADIVALGSGIQWYAQDTEGEPLPPDTPLTDNATYYASQTVNACESSDRLEVLVNLIPQADKPDGALNQSYTAGEALGDLDVTGDNLRWYEDAEATQLIPSSTLLVSQTTYYVSQQPEGHCESELLSVTVHFVLDVDDPAFEGFVLYPNPTEGLLTIANGREMEKVEVYDMAGRSVMEKSIASDTATLDFSHLTDGTYILMVTVDRAFGKPSAAGGGGTGVYRVVKK